jgi:hypothetical protein
MRESQAIPGKDESFYGLTAILTVMRGAMALTTKTCFIYRRRARILLAAL